jgi:predicted nucleic acid-binding protein
VSEWGEAEWGDAGGLYGQMLGSLNQRNKAKENNAHDVLIALTALKRGQTLVTDDRDLADVLREHGGEAITFADFLALKVE